MHYLSQEFFDLVLEGVAYSLRATLDVMQAIAPINELVATGGGATGVWLQIITDVFGIKMTKSASTEGAAYGAALLALVGSQAYANLTAALQILPDIQEELQPDFCSVYTDRFTQFTKAYSTLKTLG